MGNWKEWWCTIFQKGKKRGDWDRLGRDQDLGCEMYAGNLVTDAVWGGGVCYTPVLEGQFKVD